MNIVGYRFAGCTQVPGRVLLLALWLGVLMPHGAMAARWFDRLPADDPDVILRRGTQTTQPLPAEPQESTNLSASIAYAAGNVVGMAYNTTTGVFWSVVGGVGAIGSGVSEALWETAYMFGINQTKVPHTEVSDTAPVPVAAAEPSPKPAEPPQEQKQIDPGLLANFIYDRGARRPDGSFFVPKPLQRLFEVRTTRATAAEVPVTLKLAGRIVPDPHAHGDVEASLLGRIEPPSAGLPVLGDAVHKGQVLGYVVPAVGVVDRTQVRRQIAQLTTEIRVETENLEILKQFTFVPFRDGKIYQSEQRIAGLRRERDALLPMLQTQEALRSPTDGVISISTAIAGRIVHPGEKVFEIVNPQLLWVEASAPDPTTAESAQRVARASATTPEGQTLALAFVGSGLTVQQQSTPILFRIENPPDGLRVGRPVTVTVQSENRSQRGLPMTRDALTIGSDGVQEVWEQSEPEVFLPHAVRTQDLDGRSVLIVDGLKEGAHVVISGVRLLAQLQ